MSSSSFFKSKWFSAILMAVVAIVYICQMSNVFDRKIDLNGDNIYYFTLAQSLSSGQGYSSVTGLDGATPHMHFPPGYSAFISLFMRLGIDSIVQVKIINCILLLAGILLLFLIMKEAGCKPLLSAMVCILVSCHAEVLRWASMMMSEQLFLVVNMLIIYLLCRIDLSDIFKKSEWKTWLKILLVGILVGYSYLVRSMGLSMAVAVVMWMFLCIAVLFFKGRKENGRKIAGYCVAIAVVLLSLGCTQSAWNARNQRLSPGFKSDYIGDFKKKEGGRTMETFADWQQRFSDNAKSYVTFHIPDALFEKDNPTNMAAGIFVLFLIALGFVSMSEAGLVMLLYCLVSFFVLMIYPEQFAGLRYFLTLIPLLLLGFCKGLHSAFLWIVGKISGRQIETLALIPVLAFLFIAVPRYQKAQEYYRQVAKIRSWKNVSDPSIRGLALASEWAGKNLPPNARMLCRKPELYYMFSGYRHANSFPQYATPEEIMKLIDERRIEFIILDTMFIHSYKTIYPAIQKYPDRFRIINGWNGEGKNSIPTLMVQVIR